ncbi:MAG: hypothetical protein Q8891_02960 [Bacteroidota bacterium]|nr:hypothetical protein [Bacteroidota bacterium]
MSRVKDIISKVFLLIIDILRFGYVTARQVILPCKRKKGNLLYSLFIFFVGVIERLDNFEYGVFQMARLLRRKYIKQSLLIVASVLFVLSSLEWTGEKILNSSSHNYIEQFSEVGLQKETICEQGNLKKHSVTTSPGNGFPAFRNVLFSGAPLTSSIKTYLLFRNIRI